MKPSRWVPLAVFFALAVLLAAGVWMSRKPDRDALPSPLIGKPAPAFALPVLHEPARTVRLQDLRGQPFLLNVGCSWCVECRVAHPALTRFSDTRPARVGGYNWNDEPADAPRWLAQLGNPYWVVLSEVGGRTAIDWGIYGAPETFLVDADGNIRWKHVGPLDDVMIADELEPLLRGMRGVP